MTSLYDGKVIAIGLRIEEIVERVELDSDIIGISCMFSQDWPYIRELARALRRQFPDAMMISETWSVNLFWTNPFFCRVIDLKGIQLS